jgi:hypothetical protein
MVKLCADARELVEISDEQPWQKRLQTQSIMDDWRKDWCKDTHVSLHLLGIRLPGPLFYGPLLEMFVFGETNNLFSTK